MSWPTTIHKLDPKRVKEAFEGYRHAIQHDWMRKYGGACPLPDCNFSTEVKP